MNRGLIEAESRGTFDGVQLRLPRFMNRGLIEALAIGSALGLASELPRFMNRGLIEAGEGAPVDATEHDDFPDS